MFEEELKEVALTKEEEREMECLQEQVADGAGGSALVCACRT